MKSKPAWAPALRDGVSASRVAIHGGPWDDLLAFLQARFPATAPEWPARLAAGEVLDDNGQSVQAHSPATTGAHLWYWRRPPPEARVPFEIELLHQDEHLVVIDKPHFLATAPVGRHLHETALVRLRQQLGIATLAPVHRLDADTAGVLMFTVQPASRDAYHGLLRDRQVHKVYEAIAPWRADLALPLMCHSRLEQRAGPAFMQMQSVPGEANAQTLIELIARLGPAPGRMAAWDSVVDVSGKESAGKHMPTHMPTDMPTDTAAVEPTDEPIELAHYRLTPHTGRRHQLRAQMSALGMAIVGDRIYPQLLPAVPPGCAPNHSQPLQLLAREIAFTDPITGQPRHFTSRRRLALAPVLP